VVSWLKGYSQAGIQRVLKQLRVSLKRALNFIRSPDAHFRAKWQAILRAYAHALADPQRVVCLFADEFTYYRQPSLAPAYHPQGKTQPYARQVARYNTQTRVAAALNALSGQVTYSQKSKIGKEELPRFYALIRAAYPHAERIYLIQDNWPPHLLPAVLAALADLGLTPLFLPTYASWLNPIEKLWRWLKQDVLHLHPLAHDLEALRQQVGDFLDQFASGSEALLHYVGLLQE
jgi:transposase